MDDKENRIMKDNMKDKMMNEKMNEKLAEENLDEVSGGLNVMHLKVGGYADNPVAMHPILKDDTDARNVHPVINSNDKPRAKHPIRTDMFGKPVLVDINDADKGNNPTLA